MTKLSLPKGNNMVTLGIKPSVVVVAFMLYSALVGGCKQDTKDDRHEDSKKPEGADTASLKPDFTVTEPDLLKEYNADKQSAKTKYGGKILEVTGIVNSVENDNSTWPQLHVNLCEKIDFEHIFSVIKCFFPEKEKGRVLAMFKGQRVTIRGRWTEMGAYIRLNECTVIKAEPDPAISITAVELTKAAASNEETAKKKYNDKYLIVEGVVAKTEKKDKFSFQVTLEGFDENVPEPVRVDVLFNLLVVSEKNKKRLAALKKGDTIKLRGQPSVLKSVVMFIGGGDLID
jgi:uncharacterized protein (DUF1330 family)